MPIPGSPSTAGCPHGDVHPTGPWVSFPCTGNGTPPALYLGPLAAAELLTRAQGEAAVTSACPCCQVVLHQEPNMCQCIIKPLLNCTAALSK